MSRRSAKRSERAIRQAANQAGPRDRQPPSLFDDPDLEEDDADDSFDPDGPYNGYDSFDDDDDSWWEDEPEDEELEREARDRRWPS